MELFARRGFAVPLEEIAAQAGVGVATLYRHFPSRERLASALVARSLQPIAEFAGEAARSGEDPIASLRAMLTFGAEQHSSNLAMAQLWRTVGNDVVMDAVLSTGLYEKTQRLLRSAKAAGEVRSDVTVEDIARVFIAVAGIVEAGNERAVGRFLAIQLRGIAARERDVLRWMAQTEDDSHLRPAFASARRLNRENLLSAILFGSISTVADTSELQRKAFNDAFEENGLGWRWERDDYLELLKENGGKKRIAEYAQSQGEEVDVEAVHRSKSRLFQESLAASSISPRPGVVETIREAKGEGFKVALVTTTSKENVAALLEALSSELDGGDFDLIVDSTDVEKPKPEKDAYVYAIEKLGERAEDCVAIEDNLGGVKAAKAAGLACDAFPNENTSGHDFESAEGQLDRLSFDGVWAFRSGSAS